MDRLATALEGHRAEIGEALTAARSELEELQTRERELRILIQGAEKALGYQANETVTLHEAMTVVLRDADNAWMTTREIADHVNARALYRKRDGSEVESNQIHARAKNYEHLFEKDGQRVRLRTEDSPGPSPARPPQSKYDPLRDWLLATDEEAPELTFDQIVQLVGSLPRSAWRHQAWWANESAGAHVQARAWLNAGFRVARIDQQEGWVVFTRQDDDAGTATTQVGA